jgi:hypothetical protein
VLNIDEMRWNGKWLKKNGLALEALWNQGFGQGPETASTAKKKRSLLSWF